MELGDWINMSFVASTKGRTAYYTHPEGFPQTVEQALTEKFEVFTQPVVGVLVQHRYVEGFDHPEKSRVVPAVPYNDWEEILPVDQVAEPGADLVFVGIWPDTADYPQEEIDVAITCTRRRMVERLRKQAKPPAAPAVA